MIIQQPQQHSEDELPEDPKEAYEQALDHVGYLLADAFEDALQAFPEAVNRDELIHYLRVELGLVHHRGPHNAAPGLQSRIDLLG